MKTLRDFTPELQEKIPSYIKTGLEGVFDGGRYKNFNFKDCEKAVNWNYNKCGYKKPVIIVAENIYEQQLLFNYLVANKNLIIITHYLYCLKNKLNNVKIKSSQLHSQLHSQLDSQLDSQLYSQLYSQLDSQLHSQLHSQLRM